VVRSSKEEALPPISFLPWECERPHPFLQPTNGESARAILVAGKWVARETLGFLKQLASPEIFRKVVWENGTQLFKLRFS